MYFKYHTFLAAAAITVGSCTTTTDTSTNTNEPGKKPNISISCFEDSPCKNQIGIVNNSKNDTATNLNVSCSDIKNPSIQYTLASSFDLAPKSSNCIRKDDIAAHCAKFAGVFVDFNVEIKVTSGDLAKWKKTSLCTFD